MATNYSELTWTEVAEILRSGLPVVLLLPMGSVEPHGPHSPLCTDLTISVGICRRAAEKLRASGKALGFVLPPLPYGVTRYAGRFPGAIHISEDALHSILSDVCLDLIGKGYKYVVLVNSHFEPEHVRTVHRAIDTVLAATGRLIGFVDLTRKVRAARLSNEFQTLGSHAGRYETSLMLSEAPALVRTGTMRSLAPVPVNLVKEISLGKRDFLEMGLEQAYNGTPAEATPEEGDLLFQILVDMVLEQAEALMNGTGGRDAPGFYTRVSHGTGGA
jgi:creatinine amidohydrolase